MSRFLRTPIIPLILVVAVVFLGFQAFSGRSESTETMTYSEVVEAVTAQPSNVEQVVFKPKSRGLAVTFADGTKADVHYATEEAQLEFQQMLEGQGVAFDSESSGSSSWTPLLYIFPFILFLGLWFFLISRMQGGGSKVMSFGKSKARRMTADSPKVTFADVAGATEAVEGIGRDQGVPGESAQVSGARRAHSQGCLALRASRNWEDVARSRHRG